MDLDGTLVSHTTDYRDPEPFPERIEEVRRLYDQGHEIVVHTGRGSRSTGEYYDMTEAQLNRFGIPHDELHVGEKVVGDIIVDDTATSARSFFNGPPMTEDDDRREYL